MVSYININALLHGMFYISLRSNVSRAIIHRPMVNIECGIIQKCLVMIFNSYTSRKLSKKQFKTSFWRTISTCCQQIDRCQLGLLWKFINFPDNLHQQFVFRASQNLIKRPSRWTLWIFCLFGLHRIWSRNQPSSYPG